MTVLTPSYFLPKSDEGANDCPTLVYSPDIATWFNATIALLGVKPHYENKFILDMVVSFHPHTLPVSPIPDSNG